MPTGKVASDIHAGKESAVPKGFLRAECSADVPRGGRILTRKDCVLSSMLFRRVKVPLALE
jgi:hypothetical protein